MPHFFISSDNVSNNKITINDSDNYNHIARALRMRAGEKLLLIDENKVEYETVIEDVTKNEIVTKIMHKQESKRVLPFNIYLAQSPLRSDAQNFVIEKATELGVKGVYPVHTDNCALKEDIIDKKIDKWQKIMYEASKQCERADVPKCFERTTFENLFTQFDKIFVFCERIAETTLKDLDSLKPNENILVIIGPEGGFSQREFDLFRENKLDMLTLGNLILKAETAVTVGLGNIIYEFTTRNK